MCLYNQFKSILYKERYYSIDYKLKFILNSKYDRRKSKYEIFIINNNLIELISSYSNYIKTTFYTKDKFIFDNIRVVDNRTDINQIISSSKYEYKMIDSGLFELDGDKCNKMYEGKHDLQHTIVYLNGIVSRERIYVSDITYHKLYRDGLLYSLLEVSNKNKVITKYDRIGRLKSISHYNTNNLHNINGPARIKYYPNGDIKSKKYYCNGKLHNDNGPSVIKYRHRQVVLIQFHFFGELEEEHVMIKFDNGIVVK